jgi:hypothetical protein
MDVDSAARLDAIAAVGRARGPAAAASEDEPVRTMTMGPHLR